MHWMVFVPNVSLLKTKQGQKGSVVGEEAHQPVGDPYHCTLPCYELHTKITLLTFHLETLICSFWSCYGS